MYRPRKISHQNFTIAHPLPHSPYPLRMAEEVVDSRDYQAWGKHRQYDRHFLMKVTLAGSGRFAIHGLHWNLEPGDCFCTQINERSMHYGYYNQSDIPWSFAFFAFHAPHDFMHALFQRLGHVQRLSVHHPFLLEQLNALRSHNGPQTIDFIEAIHWTHRLLAWWTSGYQPQGLPTAVLHAQQLMADHVETALSIKELAQACDLSQEHLGRLFKQHFQLTVQEYYLRLRMQAAGDTLLRSAVTVADLARQYDFSTSSHFARSFRRVMGMSPLQYRKHH